MNAQSLVNANREMRLKHDSQTDTDIETGIE